MRRIPALVAAVGLVGGLIGGMAPAALAQSAPTGPVDFDPVCVNAPAESPFDDVNDDTTEQSRAIRCVAFAGIALGLGDGSRFEPTFSTLRGQMASFVARTVDLADDLEVTEEAITDLPPYDGANAFVDVSAGSVHVGPINRLADAGIVLGGTGGRPTNQYAETTDVTRGQIASFLARSYDYLTGNPLPAGPDAFTDDEGNAHEDAINRIAAARVAFGLAPGTFGPNLPVTRGQIAVFLARFLGLLEEQGLINPIPSAGPVDPGQIGDIAFEPFTPVTLVDVDGVMETSGTDNQVYTATGLDDTLRYRVTVVEAANIIPAGGEATFEEDGVTGLAAAGDVGAAIVAVNDQAVVEVDGVAASRAQSIGNIAPDDGTITVTLDAAATAVQRPVIYTDPGGSNTRLNVDDDGAPTEPYGVAGVLVSLPAEAPEGPIVGAPDDQDIIFVDTDTDRFVGQAVNAEEFLYNYDSNDQFTLLDDDAALGPQNPLVLTFQQFEAVLSVGDILDATSTYNPNPAGVSRFVLIDANNPPDPGPGPGPDPDPDDDVPDLIDAELEGFLFADEITLTFDEVLDPDLLGVPGDVFVFGTVLDLLGVPLLQTATGTNAVVSGATVTVDLDADLDLLGVLFLDPITPYDVTVQSGFVESLAGGVPNPSRTIAVNP